MGFILPHFSVLNHLIRVGDGKTPLELSRAFQVPKASMTHTLSGLEKAGYIEARANEQDKRSKQIFITDAGRDFRDSAIQGLEPDVNEISRYFTEEQAAAIVPALTQLREGSRQFTGSEEIRVILRKISLCLLVWQKTRPAMWPQAPHLSESAALTWPFGPPSTFRLIAAVRIHQAKIHNRDRRLPDCDR